MRALSFRIATLVAITVAVLSGLAPQPARSVHAPRDRIVRPGRSGAARLERAETPAEWPDHGEAVTDNARLDPPTTPASLSDVVLNDASLPLGPPADGARANATPFSHPHRPEAVQLPSGRAPPVTV